MADGRPARLVGYRYDPQSGRYFNELVYVLDTPWGQLLALYLRFLGSRFRFWLSYREGRLLGMDMEGLDLYPRWSLTHILHIPARLANRYGHRTDTRVLYA